MEPESTQTHPIPGPKLGHKTQQNYNRLNYKMFYKSVIIRKNRIFPNFENKVKIMMMMMMMMMVMMMIIIMIIIIIRGFVFYRVALLRA